MGYAADKVAIETWLANAPGLSGVVIKFTNAKTADPGADNYIAVSISYGDAKEASLEPTPLRRYTGTIVAQIFTKEGIGGGSAVVLADVVADRLRGQVLNSGSDKLRCYTPLLQDAGTDGRGLYQYTVATPFKRDTKH